jgi:molecular chaperone DnaK (HSP70)
MFKTAQADQRSVKVGIVEGESNRPEACIGLGECVVRDLPAGMPQDTAIEVEYSYHANGRLSVSARIPSVRYSQRVEIKRNADRNLGDLPGWQARLCGRSTASNTADSINGEHPNALQRLDFLFQSVGKIAAGIVLPEAMARSRQLANSAAVALAHAKSNVREAEQARQIARDSGDVIRFDAQLAQAREQLRQSQIRADFAYLTLGRDCVSAGLAIPTAEKTIAEIRRLRT